MYTKYFIYLVMWLFSSISPLSAVSSNSIVQPPGQVVQSPQGDVPYQPHNDNYHRDYYRNDGYNSHNRYDGYHHNHYNNGGYNR